MSSNSNNSKQNVLESFFGFSGTILIHSDTEIDVDARASAFKGLYITFIIFIAVVNFAILYKFYKQRNVITSVQRFIILTLSIGDLLVAFFSLVIQARYKFDSDYHPSCGTRVMSGVFIEFYFPFVYAFGLITLSVELLRREKIRKLMPNPYAASVMTAAVPWCLGLVVVLPLCLDGFIWDRCKYEEGVMDLDRMKSMWVVSVLVPWIFASLVCMWVNLKKSKGVSSRGVKGKGFVNHLEEPAHPETNLQKRRSELDRFQQEVSYSYQPVTSYDLTGMANPAFPVNYSRPSSQELSAVQMRRLPTENAYLDSPSNTSRYPTRPHSLSVNEARRDRVSVLPSITYRLPESEINNSTATARQEALFQTTAEPNGIRQSYIYNGKGQANRMQGPMSPEIIMTPPMAVYSSITEDRKAPEGPDVSDPTVLKEKKREAKFLSWAVALSVILYIPYSVFLVAYSNNMGPIAERVLSDIFLLMFYLRSIAVPCVWFFKIKSEKK